MSADIVELLPELPEARKPDENGAGWFTAGQMRAYAAEAVRTALAERAAVPIDMVLHCPACGLRHIDAPEDADCDGEVAHSMGWANPPHRSHLCHGCGHIWRPADVPTNGVAAITTKGTNDSPPAERAAVPAQVVEALLASLEAAMRVGSHLMNAGDYERAKVASAQGADLLAALTAQPAAPSRG